MDNVNSEVSNVLVVCWLVHKQNRISILFYISIYILEHTVPTHNEIHVVQALANKTINIHTTPYICNYAWRQLFFFVFILLDILVCGCIMDFVEYFHHLLYIFKFFAFNVKRRCVVLFWFVNFILSRSKSLNKRKILRIQALVNRYFEKLS